MVSWPGKDKAAGLFCQAKVDIFMAAGAVFFLVRPPVFFDGRPDFFAGRPIWIFGRPVFSAPRSRFLTTLGIKTESVRQEGGR